MMVIFLNQKLLCEVMSIWNSPFEMYKIEKLASKSQAFKVFFSNIFLEIIKNYLILSWILKNVNSIFQTY